MKAISETRIVALRAMPYAEYLQTPEWRQRRNRALARALWCCEWPECTTRRGLEVHHKCYERIGEELDGDLAVLCGPHHHGYHQRYDVRLVMIRAEMRARSYTSYADFAESVKAALAKHKIPYDDAEFREAWKMVEHDLKVEAARPAPAVLELDPAAPAITPRTARELIAEIRERTGIAAPIKVMPKARLVTRSQADQIKATAIVCSEIEASVERCRALEVAAGLRKVTEEP